ncbi:MAG: MFS transporter [Synergistaceae bacterium]|nr:MFS transporter [Synergistaceae bacterium]
MIVLLILIYIAFIGFGLWSSLFSAIWPVMRFDVIAPASAAGFIALIMRGSGILSSLNSNRVIFNLKTEKVILLSLLMAAISLLGTSGAVSLLQLCLWSAVLGVCSGFIDPAINNYIALHYKARHLSWLHCFWGIGATLGPMVMSGFLEGGMSWRGGYAAVSALLFVLVLILLGSFPLWKRMSGRQTAASDRNSKDQERRPVTNREALRLPGIRDSIFSLVCDSACEASAALWIASYLVEQHHMSPITAAMWTSFYYASITAGRCISGFLMIKLQSAQIIRLGCCTCIAGVVLLILPLSRSATLTGIILLGLGCAPFVPATLQNTPARFGEKFSQAVIGLQLASAYISGTFVPLLVGICSKTLTMSILPWFLLVMTIGMLLFSERASRVTPEGIA